MSKVTVGDFPGKSVDSMLPITDVNPGYVLHLFNAHKAHTHRFSTINQAKELNITPVLTFDQSFWVKANDKICKKYVHCVNTRRFSQNDELLWQYRYFNGSIRFLKSPQNLL